MMTARRPQRIFITGASSGIGAALALRYASTGAILGLAARRKDPLEQLAATFTGPCEIYPVDVRDAPSLAGAARHFIATWGCPDAVIPWQMALVAPILRILPNWLYDRMVAGAPRKPRRTA